MLELNATSTFEGRQPKETRPGALGAARPAEECETDDAGRRAPSSSPAAPAFLELHGAAADPVDGPSRDLTHRAKKLEGETEIPFAVAADQTKLERVASPPPASPERSSVHSPRSDPPGRFTAAALPTLGEIDLQARAPTETGLAAQAVQAPAADGRHVEDVTSDPAANVDAPPPARLKAAGRPMRSVGAPALSAAPSGGVHVRSDVQGPAPSIDVPLNRSVEDADGEAPRSARPTEIAVSEAYVRSPGAMRRAPLLSARPEQAAAFGGLASQADGAGVSLTMNADGQAAALVDFGASTSGAGRTVAIAHTGLSIMPDPGLGAIRQIAMVMERNGEGVFEIRLDPPELGRVVMQVAAANGAVEATIVADRPETMELLRKHADLLERDLESAGNGRVDLSFRDGEGGRGDDSQAAAAKVPIPSASPDDGEAGRKAAGAGLDLRV